MKMTNWKTPLQARRPKFKGGEINKAPSEVKPGVPVMKLSKILQRIQRGEVPNTGIKPGNFIGENHPYAGIDFRKLDISERYKMNQAAKAAVGLIQGVIQHNEKRKADEELNRKVEELAAKKAAETPPPAP